MEKKKWTMDDVIRKQEQINSAGLNKLIPDHLKANGALPYINEPHVSKYHSITINLFGEPMAKQSVRQGKSKSGKSVFYTEHKKVARVKDYQKQILAQLPLGFKIFTEVVHVRKVHFVFAPLKGFSKEKGKMEKIRAGEIFYKNTKPDLPDNLKKLPFDAMSGLVYKDDCVVVSEDNIKKYYGTGGMIIIELEGY